MSAQPNAENDNDSYFSVEINFHWFVPTGAMNRLCPASPVVNI
jgi:hypothetical protein